MSNQRRRALILFSGGADSVLMVMQAIKMSLDFTVLVYCYGQVHEEEVDAARELISKLRNEGRTIPSLHLDLTGCFEASRSRLLKQVCDRPINSDDIGRDLGVHSAHVPSRNAVFVSVALSVAESRGYDEVWIGCDYSDRVNGFPDCRQEWVEAMDKVAELNSPYRVRVKAPLLGLTKEDVLERLALHGIVVKEIFSGYGDHLPS